MKIYIAGPMTGLPDNNRAAFYLAADNLREQGHMPKHTAWMEDGLSHEEYMKNALQVMLTCDAIYMLKGWLKSIGAQTEHTIATLCGMQVMYEQEEDDDR